MTVQSRTAKSAAADDANDSGPSTASLEAELARAQAAIRALQEDRERLNFALEGSGLGMWDWNVQTSEIVVNARWAEMIRYRLDELELTLETWEELIHPDDLDGVNADLQKHLSGETEFYENTHRLKTKSGEYRWILDRGKVFAWTPDGQPLRAAGSHRDVHKEKQVEEKLTKLALRDPLTNLANRRYLESVFGHSVAYAERANSELGILYLDLDGFKPVNDELGHAAGDAVLCEVARRLQTAVRGHDVVARVGGDEFCVLVTHARGEDELVGLSHRILGMLTEPMTVEGVEASIGCSIGVSRYPHNGLALEELL